MLTDGIAAAYRDGVARVSSGQGVTEIMGSATSDRSAKPYLFSVSGDDWLADSHLQEEVFGPLGIIVRVRDKSHMHDVARAIEGQLTCTLQMDAGDTQDAQALLPLLERKAGRVLANGFPTGVEVADTMVHGALTRPPRTLVPPP